MLRTKARKTSSPPRETCTSAPSIGRPSSSTTRPASVAPRASGTSCVSACPAATVTVRDHGTKRSSSADSAVRLGRQAAHRVAAVRARAREELPALAPGHDADAREGLAVRGVHDPPGERRGRSEGDRHGLGGGLAPATAEARPRSPPSATSEPASRGAPSRRNAPSARASTQRVVCVRPSNRTRAPAAGRAPVGEGDRPPQDLPERQRHRPRERAGPDRLPLQRGEGRGLHPDPVPFLGRGLEAERPVGLRRRRLRHARGRGGVLRPPAAARPQRHGRADDRPSPLVHDPPREGEGPRQPHVPGVLSARVEERCRAPAARRSRRRRRDGPRCRRPGHRDGERPVGPRRPRDERLRQVFAAGLAPGGGEAVLERQHGTRRRRRAGLPSTSTRPRISSPGRRRQRGRDGEPRTGGRRNRAAAEGRWRRDMAVLPDGQRYAAHWTQSRGEESCHPEEPGHAARRGVRRCPTAGDRGAATRSARRDCGSSTCRQGTTFGMTMRRPGRRSSVQAPDRVVERGGEADPGEVRDEENRGPSARAPEGHGRAEDRDPRAPRCTRAPGRGDAARRRARATRRSAPAGAGRGAARSGRDPPARPSTPPPP